MTVQHLSSFLNDRRSDVVLYISVQASLFQTLLQMNPDWDEDGFHPLKPSLSNPIWETKTRVCDCVFPPPFPVNTISGWQTSTSSSTKFCLEGDLIVLIFLQTFTTPKLWRGRGKERRKQRIKEQVMCVCVCVNYFLVVRDAICRRGKSVQWSIIIFGDCRTILRRTSFCSLDDT